MTQMISRGPNVDASGYRRTARGILPSLLALGCLQMGCIPDPLWEHAAGPEPLDGTPAEGETPSLTASPCGAESSCGTPTPGAKVDSDGDGAWDEVDCAPEDPSRSPGAPERCDGRDDDCDQRVDEAHGAGASPWFLDNDGDGYGGEQAPEDLCLPLSAVNNALDCDDADPERRPDSRWSLDGDQDGWGSPEAPTVPSCAQPDGYGPPLDCDDLDPAVGGPSRWYGDTDADGFGDAANTVTTCTAPEGYAQVSGDCDDADPLVYPGSGEEVADDGEDNDCDGMVLIGAGVYPRGSLPLSEQGTGDPEAAPDELPGSWVELRPYLLEVTEVSVGDLAACLEAGGCQPPDAPCLAKIGSTWAHLVEGRADHPVRCVTFAMAEDYCAFVGRRLPTEAEWEAGARGSCPWDRGEACPEVGAALEPLGGGALPYPLYPTGQDTPACAQANHRGPGGCAGDTVPVCSLGEGASPTGALHMAGNVYEWTQDHYAPGYAGGAAATDRPTETASAAAQRSTRGGSFLSTETNIRTGNRRPESPLTAAVDIGFRCAADGPLQP